MLKNLRHLKKSSIIFHKISSQQESILFLKCLFKNPKSLGAIVPSSRKLGEFICQHVECLEEEYILEVGAGTGRFTQALLESGVPPHQLVVIELDPELTIFLKQRFPNILVIQGSAADLSHILPDKVQGKIRTIVSGIPMVNLKRDVQKSIMDSCFSSALPNAHFLQFTYRPIVPIPAKDFNLQYCHLGTVFFNFPPATVWKFWGSSSPIQKQT